MRPESATITQRIVELRGAGLSWAQVGTRVGMSRAAARERYMRATELSERQRRKHAESLNARLEARLQAAELVIHHARKWSAHDGALAYALQAYEEVCKE